MPLIGCFSEAPTPDSLTIANSAMDQLLKFFGRSGSERFLPFLPSPSWLRFRIAL